jgi:hypothetical protein
MKRGSTIFLKAVLVLIGAIALALMLWFPQTEGRAANLDLIGIYSDPFILYLYTASISFYAAFIQAFKLLGYIEKNKVFSEISVKALRNIKYCALIFTGFMVGAMPQVIIFGDHDDAPGAVVIGLIIIFAGIVVATGVAIAQKLLQKAVDIKSENDMTV